jgi:hypothetical protein
MRKAGIVWIMLLAFGYTAHSQKPAVVTSNEEGWQKIGEITADFKMQDESIVVLGADQFEAIRLKVTDAPINIDRLRVFYESGKTEEFDVQHELQVGAETKTLDLEGNGAIKKVAFTYKTLPNFRGEKAHVELYGLKAGAGNSRAYRDDKEEEITTDAKEAGEDIRERSEEVKEEVKRDLDKAGDKVSEAANNAAAGITDKIYSGKMGPDEQTIYIDKNSQYYYINDEGDKVYLSKSQLKDKPEDN